MLERFASGQPGWKIPATSIGGVVISVQAVVFKGVAFGHR
jgi:hypothetical protein